MLIHLKLFLITVYAYFKNCIENTITYFQNHTKEEIAEHAAAHTYAFVYNTLCLLDFMSSYKETTQLKNEAKDAFARYYHLPPLTDKEFFQRIKDEYSELNDEDDDDEVVITNDTPGWSPDTIDEDLYDDNDNSTIRFENDGSGDDDNDDNNDDEELEDESGWSPSDICYLAKDYVNDCIPGLSILLKNKEKEELKQFTGITEFDEKCINHILSLNNYRISNRIFPGFIFSETNSVIWTKIAEDAFKPFSLGINIGDVLTKQSFQPLKRKVYTQIHPDINKTLSKDEYSKIDELLKRLDYYL